MYCKDCPFYSGIQCHGHGEYWGTCALNNLKEEHTPWDCVHYDDSHCKLSLDDLENIKKIIKKI